MALFEAAEVAARAAAWLGEQAVGSSGFARGFQTFAGTAGS